MRKLQVVILALLILLVASTGTGWAAVSGESQLEEEMLSLVNAERTKAGLHPLIMDKELVELARMKSQDMIDKNYFSHTSPTYGDPFAMMSKFGIKYLAAGENLAGNSSIPGAHQSLMNSPGHRANILNSDFTHIGIGVVKGGPYGMMITQMFIKANGDITSNTNFPEKLPEKNNKPKEGNNQEKHIQGKEKQQKAHDKIKVILNNKKIDFDIEPFINKANRVMVPLRFISEEMKYDVDWDGSQQEVCVKNSDKNISLWIGKPNIRINGVTLINDCSPELHNSRTMVPLRLIAELMDAQVVWHPQLKEVTISK